jgi:hypothetical protein
VCDVLTVIKFPNRYRVINSGEHYKELSEGANEKWEKGIVLYECGIETMDEVELISRLVEEANKTGRRLIPSEIEAALLAA